MTELPSSTALRLLAYVDGRLKAEDAQAVEETLRTDPALREHVERLRRGLDGVESAFDTLLDTSDDVSIPWLPGEQVGLDPAGKKRPPRMLSSVGPASARARREARHGRAEPITRRSVRRASRATSRRRVLAALVGSMVLATGYLGGRLQDRITARPAYDRWLEAIAMQQRLYRRDTLIDDTPPLQSGQALRQHIRSRTGVDVTVPDLRPVALDLKRLQLLTWGKTPVIELAYLPAEGEPLSYCIMPTPAADLPLTADRIHDINLLHWRRAGIAYAVLGEHPPEILERVTRLITGSSTG